MKKNINSFYDEAKAYSEIYSVPEHINSYKNKKGEKVIIEKQKIK